MAVTSPTEIRQLPLHAKHAERGAKFGAFGNWEVPLYYRSILEEHEAVRTRAGLFDISHMGEFFVSGSGAEAFLNELLPRDITKMKAGKALYMPLLNQEGGIIDDIILYRLAADHFLLIVNAGNIETDFDWIVPLVPHNVHFKDQSPQKGLLALQGPLSEKILAKAYPDVKTSALRYYQFMEWRGGIIARTGYTGEDGFELMANLKDLAEIWDRLMEVGESDGLIPVGFGCRDTLRLEAGMLLHGHDMNSSVTPLEAGVDWAMDFSKPKFMGREVLMLQKKEGPKRKIMGFEMMDRGIPRQGCEILSQGRKVGEVTSGSFSPTLKKNIGLGYIAADLNKLGQEIEIQIRDKALKAKIVNLPFYKRLK